MDSLPSINDTLVNTLTKQLSELDLLKSMYPNQNEIILSDNNILSKIQDFVENKSVVVPNHLDFVLKLCVEGFKLEICVNLPSFYPEKEPHVYMRCNQLNRQQETILNTELTNYIKTVHENEVCLYTIITWLQEQINELKIHQENNVTKKSECPLISHKETSTFTRLWIFSHHIYSKQKREQIVKKAKEYNLTGFCLLGKPGIICIEGSDTYCTEWWKEIKAMNWKKISVRKTEIFDANVKEKWRKFESFQEVCFQNNLSKNNKTTFSKFIEEHNLSQEFSEFLGV
ncbi:RWD domain-containing protein 2A [Battus philenor]|uniref:RWD domain-containing protein 2A n=1 Tax=Battus philenor TaxID=42288 RepID=UPI0035CEDAA0